MASGVQDGGRKRKENNFGICQHFSVLVFAMSLNFYKKHDPKSYSVNLVKNGESVKDGGLKSDFSINLRILIIFQSVYCISLVDV
jgi:hypothetical protein